MKKFNQLCESILNDSNIYYHISPYKFDKFNINTVGKGMGTSLWGYGIYFTKELSTIKYYYDLMIEGYKKLYLYIVQINGNIKNEFEKVTDLTAGEIYYNLAEEYGEQIASKKMVRNYHIDGITYYTHEDGNSLVIYNDKVIKILEQKEL